MNAVEEFQMPNNFVS